MSRVEARSGFLQRFRVSRGPQSLGEARMSWNDDTEYFRKRAVTERTLAVTVSDPAVAAIHNQLAERYEALVGEAKRPTLHLVAEEAA